MSRVLRSFPLDDITIRSGGDGRTVDAYAAVFDTPTPISDRQGDYLEVLAPTAFDRTIAMKGTRFGVFYNHAMTLAGTPSERGSMPIGTPIEVRTDGRGLFTSTRYNSTPLAEEALEAIRTGAITGQSFSGRFIASDMKPPPGGWRADANGDLVTVTRTEVAMDEYGPTPFPAYADAAILGVRSGCTCGARGTKVQLEVEVESEAEELAEIAAEAADPCDCECDCCQNGQHPQMSATTSTPSSPERSALPDPDPRAAHSGRLLIRQYSIRRQLRERGLK